jgi:2-octaprenylphenol hydroxylase
MDRILAGFEMHTDIVIVGAGMVGAALACVLGEAGRAVVLVDEALPAPLSAADPVDLRVSAIAPASRLLFERVGAWEAMAALRVSPFRRMHVWDEAAPGRVLFDAADVGAETLGWIVENRLVQQALLARARVLPSVAIRAPASLDGLDLGQDGATVHLGDGRRIRCRLVVGADGAGSRTRSLARIRTSGGGYGQRTIVGTVTTEAPHEATAWQRFLPTGPVALLPLADGRSSLAWHLTADRVDSLLALDDTAFGACLTDAFGGRFGTIMPDGPRLAVPLRWLHAARYVASRLALVGDAAHVVHPLAGLGVNLGLLDVIALADSVEEDPGAPPGLGRYQRQRRGANLLMQTALTGFKQVFGSRLPPLVAARAAAMMLADRVSPLRAAMMRQAMGLG